MEPVTRVDVEPQLPNPGDIVVSRRTMRAWDSDEDRGFNGMLIGVGEIGIVIQRWQVGGKVRLRLLINDQVVVFACRNFLITMNWAFSDALNENWP